MTISILVELIKPIGTDDYSVRAVGGAQFGGTGQDACIERWGEAAELAIQGLAPHRSVACAVVSDGALVAFADLVALEHVGALMHLLRAANEDDERLAGRIRDLVREEAA